MSNDEIIERYSDYEILIIKSTRKIDKEFIDKTNFKIIATCSKGVDHIDIDYAKKKKLIIINSEKGNYITAAEHTIALILSILKNISFADNLIRSDSFSFHDFYRAELFGKTVGIIGFGKVGSLVGKYLSVFGVEIIANDIDPKVRQKYKNYNFKPLNFLLKNSDIITIHIPYNKRNINFIDKDKFERMKDGVIFINTSRGGVVEEKSLIYFLKMKKILFAGLDVFLNEPNINYEFKLLENVILTNHIAGKTPESEKRILLEIFEKINNLKERMM
ncbi:MAG: hypothetical protein N2490_00320 [Ignavibacteria bacterium]|nr:hypothetical protein [Ignavibacteria bacterium]